MAKPSAARWLAPLFLGALAGCPSAPLPGAMDLAGLDLLGDLATGACPLAQPDNSGIMPCPSRGLQCLYGDTRCECAEGTSGSAWFCRPAACPNPQDAHGPCAQIGLSCTYGFESGCGCIGPESQWLCCGGVVTCPPEPSDGAPCCGAFGAPCRYDNGCGGTRSCYCAASHYRCDPPPGCVDMAM